MTLTYRVTISLARHTPQWKGKGDSAYCELYSWNAIIAGLRGARMIIYLAPAIFANTFTEPSFVRPLKYSPARQQLRLWYHSVLQPLHDSLICNICLVYICLVVRVHKTNDVMSCEWITESDWTRQSHNNSLYALSPDPPFPFWLGGVARETRVTINVQISCSPSILSMRREGQGKTHRHHSVYVLLAQEKYLSWCQCLCSYLQKHALILVYLLIQINSCWIGVAYLTTS